MSGALALAKSFPEPGGEWRMTVKTTPHFMSHIHVDMAKHCTQKNMCKNNNGVGCVLIIFDGKFTQISLPFNLIMPRQWAGSLSR